MTALLSFQRITFLKDSRIFKISEVLSSLSTKSKKASPPSLRNFNQELGNDLRYDLLENHYNNNVRYDVVSVLEITIIFSIIFLIGIIGVQISLAEEEFFEINDFSKLNDNKCNRTEPINLNFKTDAGMISSICFDKDTETIIMNLENSSHGTLETLLPRILSELIIGNACNGKKTLLIFIDGVETEFNFEKGKKYDLITIPIDVGSEEIEIIGNVSKVPALIECIRSVLTEFSPNEQTRYGISKKNVICKDNFELIFKRSDSPACVKESSITKLMNRGWAKISDFKVSSGFFNHTINNGQVILMQFAETPCSVLITVKIDSKGQGNLVIPIPKIFEDPPLRHGENSFFILVDGERVDFKEFVNDLNQRTVDISFSKDSESIELVKSCF